MKRIILVTNSQLPDLPCHYTKGKGGILVNTNVFQIQFNSIIYLIFTGSCIISRHTLLWLISKLGFLDCTDGKKLYHNQNGMKIEICISVAFKRQTFNFIRKLLCIWCLKMLPLISLSDMVCTYASDCVALGNSRAR